MTEPTAAEPVELPTSDCTVCRHPDAAAVDAGLLAGTPIRTVAETFGLTRSSVGRHRQNHLTLQTITEPPAVEGRQPLRLVDVHRQMAGLAGRLEAVVELAARTRKAPAAVAAMRELRQTLEAIARIQADPDLQRAATLEAINTEIDRGVSDWMVALIDFLGRTAGLDLRSQLWSNIVAQCIQSDDDGPGDSYRSPNFTAVDVSAVALHREQEALDRAARMEVEVQRRVEAELRKREMQQRPAIEARPVLELESGVTGWSA